MANDRSSASATSARCNPRMDKDGPVNRSRCPHSAAPASTVVFPLVCAVGLIPWTVGLACKAAGPLCRRKLDAHLGRVRYCPGCLLRGHGLGPLESTPDRATSGRLYQRPAAVRCVVSDVLTAHGGRDLLVSAATALLGRNPGSSRVGGDIHKAAPSERPFVPQTRPETTHQPCGLPHWAAPSTSRIAHQ